MTNSLSSSFSCLGVVQASDLLPQLQQNDPVALAGIWPVPSSGITEMKPSTSPVDDVRARLRATLYVEIFSLLLLFLLILLVQAESTATSISLTTDPCLRTCILTYTRVTYSTRFLLLNEIQGTAASRKANHSEG
jgi:hypothetical protein